MSADLHPFSSFILHPSSLILAIAPLLDYTIGDPRTWLHPVQVMGWCIGRYTHWALKFLESPLLQRWAGVFLGLVMVVGSGWVGWGIGELATGIHSLLGIVINAVMVASCLAGRSLRRAAMEVLQPLGEGDPATEASLIEANLIEARSRLSRYVGRDTENLTEAEILRAVLETVTENAVDGVMAPLFWAIAGSFTPIGSAPFALAYKAASTLDSMVGYRDAPYTNLGWFSARLDDGLTWLPCRLTVLTLALVSGRPLQVWRICRRDAPKDSSPNSGWSECVYAAILGVQVGGTNTYRGKVKQKPLLGEALRPITVEIVERSLSLTRIAFLIWVAIALLGQTLGALKTPGV